MKNSAAVSIGKKSAAGRKKKQGAKFNDHKEQRIAEVSATKRILQAIRVRVGAVLAVAKSPLLYLAKQFGNAGVGLAARLAWEKIVALLSLLG